MDGANHKQQFKMIERAIYQAIAATAQAKKNCIDTGNEIWEDKHNETLEELEKLLPSGSGIDTGTTINIEKTTDKKIVLKTAFHHMDEIGGYDGWTEHEITITPNFNGINIKVSGRNRNDIKEYLHEVFSNTLSQATTL